MREIPLTKGMVTIIDDDDYELVSQYKWCVRTSEKGRYYAGRNTGSNNVYLHRWLLNAQFGIEVDHINGNTLDNRRSNLRLCTRVGNGRNGRKHRLYRSTSKYKGVYWSVNKWQAQIRVGRERFNLGRFTNEEEAARAYNEAASKYYGEFARLNVIGDQ